MSRGRVQMTYYLEDENGRLRGATAWHEITEGEVRGNGLTGDYVSLAYLEDVAQELAEDVRHEWHTNTKNWRQTQEQGVMDKQPLIDRLQAALKKAQRTMSRLHADTREYKQRISELEAQLTKLKERATKSLTIIKEAASETPHPPGIDGNEKAQEAYDVDMSFIAAEAEESLAILAGKEK